MSAYVEFTCLYTAQKLKKAKTWQDGFLRYYIKNSKVVLYDTKKSSLDSTFHKGAVLAAGDEMEMDRHLITIEECIGLVANDGPPEPATAVNIAQRYPVQQRTMAIRPPMIPSAPHTVSANRTGPPYSGRLAALPEPTSGSPSPPPPSSLSASTVAATASTPQGSPHPTSVAPPSSSSLSPMEANPPIAGKGGSAGGLERVKRKKWRAPFNEAAMSASATHAQHSSLDMGLQGELYDHLSTTAGTAGNGVNSSAIVVPGVVRPGPMDVMPIATTAQATSSIVSAASLSSASSMLPPDKSKPQTQQPPKRRRVGLGPGSSIVSVSGRQDGGLKLSQRPPPTSLEFPNATRCSFLTGGGTGGGFNQQGQNLKRFQGLGARFATPAQYKEGMTGLILEHMQILVTQFAIKFWNAKSTLKLSSHGGEGFDNAYRGRGIAMYSGCSLRRRGDSGVYAGFPVFTEKTGGSRGLEMMQPGLGDTSEQAVVITVSNKEHHSHYSKDDVWVITLNPTFDPQSTFFARSVFYGPSGAEIDLTCITPKDSSIARSLFPNVTSVFAVRIMNAMTEFLMLDNLQEALAKSPILPTILNYVPPEQIRASKGPVFKPPTKVADNRSGCIVLTEEDHVNVEQEVQAMIERFHLNEDQATVLRNFALQVIRAPGWAADKSVADMPPLMLVHGIFGAGKSFLIAVLIVFLDHILTISRPLPREERSYKVLITAMTNVAVDRVLTALLDLGYDKIVRVGSVKKVARRVLPFTAQSNATNKASEEIKELQSILDDDSLLHSERRYVRQALGRFQKYKNRGIAEDAMVVGTTCIASTFEILEGVSFPIVIVDEASQLLEPLSMIPICRAAGEKVILVGDPLQLSPPIHTNADVMATSKGLSRTLFDRAMEMGVKPVMLRTQYRCHPRIAEICNALFYSNVLKTGVAAAQRMPLIEGLPTLAFVELAGGAEMQQAKNKSYTNPVEAKLIVQMVEALLRLNVRASEIGVISPYKNQADAIAEGFQQQHREGMVAGTRATGLRHGGVQISTVDAFQGSEKNVIILSTVRTNAIGFIDHHQRVNVALSRSRRHLLIVGHAKLLESNDIWGKVINGHCKATRDGIVHGEEFVRKLRTLEPLSVVEESGTEESEPEDEEDDEDEAWDRGSKAFGVRHRRRSVSGSEEQETEEDEEDGGDDSARRGHAGFHGGARDAPQYGLYTTDSDSDSDDGATDEEGSGGRVAAQDLLLHRQRIQQRLSSLRSEGSANSSGSSTNTNTTSRSTSGTSPRVGLKGEQGAASRSTTGGPFGASATTRSLFSAARQPLPPPAAMARQGVHSVFAQARAAKSRSAEATTGVEGGSGVVSMASDSFRPEASSLPPPVRRIPPPTATSSAASAITTTTAATVPTAEAVARPLVSSSRLHAFAFDKGAFRQQQEQEKQQEQQQKRGSALETVTPAEDDVGQEQQQQQQQQQQRAQAGMMEVDNEEEEEREIWAMSEDSGMEDEAEQGMMEGQSEHKLTTAAAAMATTTTMHKQWESEQMQMQEREHGLVQGQRTPQLPGQEQERQQLQQHEVRDSKMECELSRGLKRVLSNVVDEQGHEREMEGLTTTTTTTARGDQGPGEGGGELCVSSAEPRAVLPKLDATVAPVPQALDLHQSFSQGTASQRLEDLELESGSQWGSVGFGTLGSRDGPGSQTLEARTANTSEKVSEMEAEEAEEEDSLACLELGDLD